MPARPRDQAHRAVQPAPRARRRSNPSLCLLEQGVPCNGPATRDGCGAKCPLAGAPCIGCYGPADGVVDFGARLLSAFASVVDASEPEEIDRILDGLPDPVGQFYRFSLAGSLLRGSRAVRAGAGRHAATPRELARRPREPPMTRLTIDPITRLEGHGKIEIFLDDQGDVERTYFQVPELRGFESFCVGRPVEEMPTLTNRICGVCPEAHHLAAAKAADAVYGVDPPRPAKLLRELLYCAFFVTDHTTHFYALGGPDVIVGPGRPGRRSEHPRRHPQGRPRVRQPGDRDAPRRPPRDRADRRPADPPVHRGAGRADQGDHRGRARRDRGDRPLDARLRRRSASTCSTRS